MEEAEGYHALVDLSTVLTQEQAAQRVEHAI